MTIRLVTTLVVALVASAPALARAGTPDAVTPPAVAPTKLVMELHIGWRADPLTGAKVCFASEDECRSRQVSARPGGFDYPSSVATDPRTGDLYVGDLDNYRVQEFSPSGAFLSMFGSQGDAAGELKYPGSVAVDPASGAVYVLERDLGDYRVDKYTAAGRFLWAVGKDVNETTKSNLCTASGEGPRARCQAGREAKSDALERQAFKFAPQYGDLLAVGGPDDLLYVGDEHRVQELDGAGKWIGEIPLASLSAESGSAVGALAVAPDGELYVVYATLSRGSATSEEHANVVRRFDRAGDEVGEFTVSPRLPNATVHIDGIALDLSARTPEIAVIGVEGGEVFHARFGFLYEAATGRLIGEFPPPADNDGLTFNSHGDLYVAATDDQQVVGYVPGSPAELVSGPVGCGLQPGQSSVASFECALHRQWLGDAS